VKQKKEINLNLVISTMISFRKKCSKDISYPEDLELGQTIAELIELRKVKNNSI